jgi:hypothetical protein
MKYILIFLLVVISCFVALASKDSLVIPIKGTIVRFNNPTSKNYSFKYIYQEGILGPSKVYFKQDYIESEYKSFGLKFYLDSSYNKNNKVYLRLLNINDEGYVINTDRNKYNYDYQASVFIVSNLKKSIQRKELLVTDSIYVEPIKFSSPIRAVKYLVLETPNDTLYIIVAIYALLILILMYFSQTRLINQEDKILIEPEEYSKYSKDLRWLMCLYNESEHLGNKFRFLLRDRKGLLKFNKELIDKYSFRSIEIVKRAFVLIDIINEKWESSESDMLKKLRKKDPELADIWHGWDSDVSKLVKGNQAMLQKMGLGDSDAAKDSEDIIKRYGLVDKFEFPEVKELIKILSNQH